MNTASIILACLTGALFIWYLVIIWSSYEKAKKFLKFPLIALAATIIVFSLGRMTGNGEEVQPVPNEVIIEDEVNKFTLAGRNFEEIKQVIAETVSVGEFVASDELVSAPITSLVPNIQLLESSSFNIDMKNIFVGQGSGFIFLSFADQNQNNLQLVDDILNLIEPEFTDKAHSHLVSVLTGKKELSGILAGSVYVTPDLETPDKSQPFSVILSDKPFLGANY